MPSRGHVQRVGVVGGLPFDPTWFPGLAVNLDASVAASIASSGGAVSAWTDQFAALSAAQATGTAQPTTGVATIGGKNAIRFDGSTDYLQINPFSFPFASWTLYVVLALQNRGGAGSEDRIVTIYLNTAGNDWANTQGCIMLYESNDTTAFATSWNNSTESFVTDTLGSSALVTTKRTGTAWSAYKNGSVGTAGPASASTAHAPTRLLVGAGWDGSVVSNFAQVDLGQILLYGVSHLASEQAQIEAALKAKWSTP